MKDEDVLENMNHADDFGDCDEVFLDCACAADLLHGEEEEEDGGDCGVGEWLIERSELSFHKKIVGAANGHAVHAGKWHGDVNIHTFSNSSFDLNEVRGKHLSNSSTVSSPVIALGFQSILPYFAL